MVMAVMGLLQVPWVKQQGRLEVRHATELHNKQILDAIMGAAQVAFLTGVPDWSSGTVAMLPATRVTA
jgi:hypothetical protein